MPSLPGCWLHLFFLTMFGCYPWEDCSFLKGNRETADLGERWGSGLGEWMGGGYGQGSLYERRINEKKKKRTLFMNIALNKKSPPQIVTYLICVFSFLCITSKLGGWSMLA